ncbi:lithostathine-1-alpha-like [Syngnathus acus]|uniref:lithostathine-1-alpha-like n=1 Tax=Syngnathus acus TaxID=161584 RepID=UPI0018864A1F|nr:lithostathine-1-alpha-like [Syngnathus acus]
MAFALRSLFLLCGISGLLTGVWSFPAKDTANVNCPAGWTQLDCSCYIYQDEARNFADGEAVCNILGGNLVSIHNALENAIVQQLIAAEDTDPGTPNLAWIGLHDSIEDGDYIWTDGTVENFRNFGSGEPNSSNGDCVRMDETTGLWETGDCPIEDEYVCIQEAHHFY